MEHLMHAKTLCKARRRNGTPCGNPPMNGSTVCRMHGGAAPQVRRRAQQRLDESSDIAVLHILKIMRDESVPANVRLAAAKDVLDRSSIVGKQHLSVEVEVKPWEEHMSEVIVQYSSTRDPNIEDAVIVEDVAAIEAAHDERTRQNERTRALRKRRGVPTALPSEQSLPASSAATPRRARRVATDQDAPAWFDLEPKTSPRRQKPPR